MAKILRRSQENHKAQFPKLSVVMSKNRYFSQFISAKVKKILRKSEVQFWEKLRKLRYRQNNGFLIKKTCIEKYFNHENVKTWRSFARLHNR